MSYSFEEEFTRLQDFIKAYDITRYDSPVGVVISTSGTIFLKYSISGPVVCKDIVDVAKKIHEFLVDK